MPMPFDLPPRVSQCPPCAAEAAAKREADEVARHEAERKMTISRLLAASQIPARYRDATIDGYEGDATGHVRARKACQSFVNRWQETRANGPSIVMCGRPGTGKTHLACAIGLDLIERYGSRVMFSTALAAIRTIKDTYHRDSEVSESEAIDRLVTPDLLILDEIGVQVGSEHERMLVFEVINERYQQCRSTILISNLNKQELTEYMGDRIMDRFRECGGVLAFDWQSYRGTQRA
jgi:DNA replication protein DnaC